MLYSGPEARFDSLGHDGFHSQNHYREWHHLTTSCRASLANWTQREGLSWNRLAQVDLDVGSDTR